MQPRLWEDSPIERMAAVGWRLEPYGELSYLEAIESFSEQACRAKQRGAKRLLLCDMPGLHEARAALLGARAAGLPAAVSLRWDGQTPDELLAALVCLQSLHAAAFGLDIPYGSDVLSEGIAALYPYADIPLLVRPHASLSAKTLAQLVASGISLVADPSGTIRREMLDGLSVPIRPARSEDAPLLLADESGVYYVEEDFTQSEPISCSLDMLDDILEQEDRGFDALCFHIKSADDAHFLGCNMHMVRCAVSLLAEDAASLEMALVLYSGRALIDSRSDVEDAELEALAADYGAIVR